VTDAEPALPVACLVDESHHRRVGRDEDAPLGVLLGHQVHRRGVGQVPLEGVHCLVDQRHAVRQEQHALRPVAAHQQVGQRDHRAGLARARGHHQQRLAVVVALEGLGDAPDAARLIEALDDCRVDIGAGQRLATAAALDQQLQLRLLVEALYRARRVVGVVPQPVLVAVGVEDQRPLAELPLQAIGVELGLLLADARIAPSALGFDESQWSAVVAPEHVVHEALALVVGHARDFELAVARLIERPAGFLEQQVDEVVARLGFGVVVGVRLRGCGLLGRGDLGAQALQLLVERRAVGQHYRELFVALAQRRLQLLQLLRRLLRRDTRLRQRGGIEDEPRRRALPASVGAAKPVTHMEELAHRHQRVVRRDRAMAMHRAVAECVDDPRLAEHRLARRLLEARLVDQRGQIVLVGQLERRVVLVSPRHHQLQRAPGVEAGRARVGVHGLLGLRRRLADGGPFAAEEGELAHASPPRLSQVVSRFCRDTQRPDAAILHGRSPRSTYRVARRPGSGSGVHRACGRPPSPSR